MTIITDASIEKDLENDSHDALFSPSNTTVGSESSSLALAFTPLSVGDIPTVFADLTPVPQDDFGSTAVCCIDYSPEFVTAHDLFRAVLRTEERSVRVTRLTAACLRLNAANYTVWHVRRECLEQYDSLASLEWELAFATTLGGDNPKNYQIWYHRRAMLERLCQVKMENETEKNDNTEVIRNTLRNELGYIRTVLSADSKNYHAWSHRQWVVACLATRMMDTAIWSQELEYVDTLLQEDVRNNSAWNHRWFVKHQGQQRSYRLEGQVAKEEAEYALQYARMDPFNESPWRYFIAIVKELLPTLGATERLDLLIEYEKKTWEVQNVLKDFYNDNESISCPCLFSTIIDLLELKGNGESLKEVCTLTKAMAEQHDPIRRKYWIWRGQQAEEKLEK